MADRPPHHRLVSGLARGDARAYAALYDLLAGRLWRAARAMLGDEADDAVQDVFLDLVRYRRNLRGVTNLEAYVFRCLRAVISRRLARRQAEESHLRRLGAGAARNVDARDVPDDSLLGALGALPPEQREVVALRIGAGMTFAAIGEMLGISMNTAASRYRYAIGRLRTALLEAGR